MKCPKLIVPRRIYLNVLRASMATSYHVPPPTLAELQNANSRFKLGVPLEQLLEYQKIFKGTAETYNKVDEMKLPQQTLKGDRTVWEPKDNRLNAWYVKCNIKTSHQEKLHGLKVAVKDNIVISNVPMMNGSKVIEGYVPEYDAAVIDRLLKEGGEIVGKTTCEDLCCSGGSFMTARGPVRNPFSMEHSAGGSSSGSAVVVATGEADLAIGGDQDGSVRKPASSCGIVGLKPTHGLIPYTGAVPIVPFVDHLGPMAKNVKNCALFLEVLAGYDHGADYRQNQFIQQLEYTKLIYPIKNPERKIKIAILREGVNRCDIDIINVFNEAVDSMRENDVLEFNDVSLPIHKESAVIATPLLMDGTFGCMIDGRGYGTGFGGVQSQSLADKMRDGYAKHSFEVSDAVKFFIFQGYYMKEKFGQHFYSKASSIAVFARQQYNRVLEAYDVIIMPTLNKQSPMIPEHSAPLRERIDKLFSNNQNTSIFNVTGHPALSLNCSFIGYLPVGLMVVGKHFDEVAVLNAAAIFEECLQSRNRNCPAQ